MEKTLKKYFPFFVLPTLITFSIVFLIPFILGIGLSFTKFTTIFNAKFIGFDNYIKAFSSSQKFGQAFGFTTIFTIVSIITINVFAFSIALILTRNIKGTNLFMTVLLLKFVGQGLLADQKFGFWGLVLLMNWQLVGYMMVIYIAGLQNVSPSLIEAAQIDGASKWTILKDVTIPMVMPSITICLFLSLTNSFKLYDQNLALTAGAPLNKTEMLAMNIVNTMFGRVGYEGVGQAKAVVFFVIVAIIAYVQLKFTRDKEVEE